MPPYYVLKKLLDHDEEWMIHPTTFFNCVLWYPTYMHPVTLFDTKEEALKAIQASKLFFGDRFKYRVIDNEIELLQTKDEKKVQDKEEIEGSTQQYDIDEEFLL